MRLLAPRSYYNSILLPKRSLTLEKYLPIINWARGYRLQDFHADAVAGVIVLFITIPQVIAYAFLAGLPAQAGLYAAVAAIIFYAAFGSSRTLVVGPAAIIAMMTIEAVSKFAAPGSAEYTLLVMKLGMVTGMVLIALRLINFGALVNFLSHAVVTGFISAAAVLIIFNQLPGAVGILPESDGSLFAVLALLKRVEFNDVVIMISATALVLLWVSNKFLGNWLLRLGLSETLSLTLVRSVPMVVVVIGIVITAAAQLDVTEQVAVVGVIPATLPSFAWLNLTLADVKLLLPSALLIAMVVFLESTSVGTAMASKKRQKLDANQELIGLGMANIGAALVSGLPVAGSFGRTGVNYSAGARTPVASLVTAALVMVTLLWFAPLFYYLPEGILAAIVIISAWQLIDVPVIRRIFTFNTIDAVTFTVTFLAVLLLGVESGILVGVIISFALLIRNSSRPHIVVVGRVGESEHFRNVERFETKTSNKVLAARVDQSIYFVNTRFIENFLLSRIAESDELEHVLLICTATNFIDTSGLEMLEHLCDNLQEAGITLHLAEVKSAVMDKLNNTDFEEHMKGNIYFTTDVAMKDLGNV